MECENDAWWVKICNMRETVEVQEVVRAVKIFDGGTSIEQLENESERAAGNPQRNSMWYWMWMGLYWSGR